MILHFLEAMLVESVAAWQDTNIISRIKQILGKTRKKKFRTLDENTNLSIKTLQMN